MTDVNATLAHHRLHVFAVAPVTDVVLRRALVLAWPDFEDAVCAACADAAGCDAIDLILRVGTRRFPPDIALFSS